MCIFSLKPSGILECANSFYSHIYSTIQTWHLEWSTMSVLWHTIKKKIALNLHASYHKNWECHLLIIIMKGIINEYIFYCDTQRMILLLNLLR